MKVTVKKKIQKSICKHCGMPIRVVEEIWVHDDHDEDPKAEDYGWLKCSGAYTVAEPKLPKK